MYKLYFWMFASFLLLNSRKRLILSFSLLSCKLPFSLKKIPTTHTHTYTYTHSFVKNFDLIFVELKHMIFEKYLFPKIFCCLH